MSKQSFLSSQAVDQESVKMAVCCLTSLGRKLAEADKLNLAVTLNALTEKEAISSIHLSLGELDQKGEYLALARLAESLKRAVSRSNDGKGTKLNFLGEYGGKVIIPLKWQKNPKLCLGLDKEKGISFEIFSEETKNLEQSLKKVKEELAGSKIDPDKQIEESLDKIASIMGAIAKLGKEQKIGLLARIKHEYADSLQDESLDIAVSKANAKAEKQEKVEELRNNLTQNMK